MSVQGILKVYDGQEPDLCFGAAPGPGGVNSVGVGLGLTQTGSNANPIVNLGMTAVGDILVGSGVNTGAVLGLGAAGDFLRVNLAGTDLEYAVVAPGGVNSVAVGAGLTQTGTAANPIVNLGMTAVGDILVGSGVNTGVKLGLGAAGEVLRVNQAGTDLEYAAVAPGGSGVIVFRNSEDNTPLIITKPATANDTCVITADRVFNNVNIQPYNVAGPGAQTGTQSFLLTSFTPTNSLALSSITVNVKLQSNAIQSAQTNVALTTDAGGTNVISGSDPVGIGAVSTYTFTNFSNMGQILTGGTTFFFQVFITLGLQEDADNFINGTPVGDVNITGIDFPANAVSSFTCPVGTKFKVPNDTVGKSSATCGSFASQSFVASADTNDWVMTGAQNAEVVFAP